MTASHRLTVDRHMAVRFHIFVEFFEYDRMYQQNKKTTFTFVCIFVYFFSIIFDRCLWLMGVSLQTPIGILPPNLV